MQIATPESGYGVTCKPNEDSPHPHPHPHTPMLPTRLSISRATAARTIILEATSQHYRGWGSNYATKGRPLIWYADLVAPCLLDTAGSQVDDPTKVFVHVALGFHVEFTLPEAISFVGVKRSSLATTIVKLKEQETELARDVVSAEAMVQELRELSPCAAR